VSVVASEAGWPATQLGWAGAPGRAWMPTACRAELAALERTGLLLEKVGPEAAPDDWEQVRRRLYAISRRPARPRLRLAWGLAMGGAALALAVLGGVVVRPAGRVTPPVRVEAGQVDQEMWATMEDHLSAAWAAPLADEAAMGLRLAEVETEG